MQPEMSPSEYIGYYAKERTRQLKRNCMMRYLSIVTEKPITDFDAQWIEYVQNPEQVRQDLISFANHPGTRHMAPLTIMTYLSAVESYLADCCSISLTNLQKLMRKRNRAEKIRVVSHEAEPTRGMIRAILAHCDERTTAEVLIIISGGLRIHEVVNLRHDDVQLDRNPVPVVIRAENAKNGLERTTYISQEAAEALKAYYRVRELHIKRAAAKTAHTSPNLVYDDEKIFPFSTQGERTKLNTAIKKAGFDQRDPRTKRLLVHFHLYRKMFLTEGKRVAAPEYVEAWAGHTGYLSESYHRPTADQQVKEYLKAEAVLTINVPDDYEQIKVEQASEIANLQQTNTHLMAQLTSLQAAVEDMQREQERITFAQISGLPRRLPHDDPDISDV